MMALSLDDGIFIHATVLTRKRGKMAVEDARARAESCRRGGDEEGFLVWSRVAASAGEFAAGRSATTAGAGKAVES